MLKFYIGPIWELYLTRMSTSLILDLYQKFNVYQIGKLPYIGFAFPNLVSYPIFEIVLLYRLIAV